MAVERASIITYDDLIQSVITYLKSICCNIGSFKSNVPNQLKNGGSFTIREQSYNDSGRRVAHTKKIVGTVSDSLCTTVQETKVDQQLREFLNGRGIGVTTNNNSDTFKLENTIISMKSMMNFYANVSSFIASKIVLIGNSYGVKNGNSWTWTDPFVFYNGNETDYTNVPFGYDIDFTKNDITSCKNSLMESITRNSHVHNAFTNIAVTCSSSSSSCSSSSSSSSSSSFFIAFMEL